LAKITYKYFKTDWLVIFFSQSNCSMCSLFYLGFEALQQSLSFCGGFILHHCGVIAFVNIQMCSTNRELSDASWIVLKFGGTSVSTAKRWECICAQVTKHLSSTTDQKKPVKVWVTISAMTQVTNKLTEAIKRAVLHRGSYLEIVEAIVVQHFTLAYEVGLFPSDTLNTSSSIENHDRWKTKWIQSVMNEDSTIRGAMNSIDPAIPQDLHPLIHEFKQLLRILEGIRLTEEASPRIQARVLSFGELLSTHLGLCIMKHYGLESVERVDARELLKSDPTSAKSEEDRYLQAEIAPKADIAAATAASKGKQVVLAQGFIASTTDGSPCVLGRGGSDTSGSLFAALLQAIRYEIWTDVHGMFTSDPRYVPEARLIKCLDYREAQELAAMGAKVLHPRCIVPAQWAKVPLEIRNTNDPDGDKTIIRPSEEDDSASPKVRKKKNQVFTKSNNTNTYGIHLDSSSCTSCQYDNTEYHCF
jgi:aspartate kinase